VSDKPRKVPPSKAPSSPGHAAPTAAPASARKPVGGETARQLAKAVRAQQTQHFLLRLYVTGTTPASVRAIERVRAFCEEHLQGRFELEVFDIHQMPALAQEHQIIATPTLVKVLPNPLRRFVGDLSRIEKVLFGLDLRAKD
jgi:circadian clock protein KaiB